MKLIDAARRNGSRQPRARCSEALARCRRRDSNPRHADYDYSLIWLNHRKFGAGWTRGWTQPRRRARGIPRVLASTWPSSAPATHGPSPIGSCPRAAGGRSAHRPARRPAEVRPMVWSESDLTIAGTCCYHVHDWPRNAAMIERGRFPVQRTVTSRIDLEEIVPAGLEVFVGPRGSEINVLVELARSRAAARSGRREAGSAQRPVGAWRSAARRARGGRPALGAACHMSRGRWPRRRRRGR